jgi:hypothetical protein
LFGGNGKNILLRINLDKGSFFTISLRIDLKKGLIRNRQRMKN